MKTSVGLGAYGRTGIKELTEYVKAAEKLSVDAVWSAEAWGTDAVTSLAYLAGQTEKIRLGTGHHADQRAFPSMIAMTRCRSTRCRGRFILGLGVSGPQVVEGLHGAAV